MAITDCFKKLGVEASQELIALYSTIGGMEEEDYQLFRLWPLKEILEENSTPEEIVRCKKDGVLFADYLLDSWCYRIKVEVVLDCYDKNESMVVKAKSLTEFFERMLKDPDGVLL